MREYRISLKTWDDPDLGWDGELWHGETLIANCHDTHKWNVTWHLDRALDGYDGRQRVMGREKGYERD